MVPVYSFMVNFALINSVLYIFICKIRDTVASTTIRVQALSLNFSLCLE